MSSHGYVILLSIIRKFTSRSIGIYPDFRDAIGIWLNTTIKARLIGIISIRLRLLMPDRFSA